MGKIQNESSAPAKKAEREEQGLVPESSAEQVPENEVQNQATVEELGREGLGVAAKE